MAYSIGKTSALQTAVKAGVDIALAELQAGILTTHDDVMARFGEVKEELKVELLAQVEDDIIQAGVQQSAPRSSGGGTGGGTPSGAPFTLDDAKNLVLNFGAFKGLTLGDVITMSAQDAQAYSGGSYKRSGLDWVKWCASNKDPKGKFASERAALVLADYNTTGQALNVVAGP